MYSSPSNSRTNPGFKPISRDGDRPVFAEKQIMAFEQLVPGMILSSHSVMAGSLLEPPELILIRAKGEWAYFLDPVRDHISLQSLCDHSVLPYNPPVESSFWNLWNFWVDTGKTISPLELEALQKRLYSSGSIDEFDRLLEKLDKETDI